MERSPPSVRRPPLALIGTLTWALVLALAHPTQAQISAPFPSPAPRVAEQPFVPVGEMEDFASIGRPPEWSQSPELPAFMSSDPTQSFLNVAHASLFGDAHSEAAKADWRPLSLDTFFTDGWREPYIDPPAGSGGARRSGWVNSFEGTFFRAWFLSFASANDLNRNGNQYLGGYTIYTPLNRRCELRVDVPFVASNKGGANDTYHDRFGDLVISPRFLLSATRDFSQIFALNVRTPTGSYVNGNGVDSLSPQYQFWYNLYGNWAVRGGTGVTVPTSGAGGGASYFANLGFGRYWEGADAAVLRHQWLTLVANLSTPLSGTAPGPTYLSLTPGYRVQIHEGWFFLAGLEVPLTSHSPFAIQPIFLLLKDY
ncbi:MAG: hypothetical protein ACHRXM_09675 [Isosphaerales bacterium]